MSEQPNSLESLLTQILAEQVRQTALLQRMADQQLILIQAMREQAPLSYWSSQAAFAILIVQRPPTDALTCRSVDIFR